jgi:hypothetical protein
VLATPELERGREELAAEAARLELRADEIRRRDEVLEVGVADHEPLEAEGVRTATDLRARVARGDP